VRVAEGVEHELAPEAGRAHGQVGMSGTETDAGAAGAVAGAGLIAELGYAGGNGGDATEDAFDGITAVGAG
jgi:hypothetical protein